jgi:hypothetical protein
MAEPARPFWEADELVAKAPPRQPARGFRPFWEEDELVATKAETKANPGIWEAIGRGALQGATLGAGDELYAGGVGALAKAQGQDFQPEFERQLAETQAANKAAKEANPWSYGIAEAVGAVPGLVYGGTTALGAKALGIAGRTLLGRSAAAAASGAGIGAIQARSRNRWRYGRTIFRRADRHRRRATRWCLVSSNRRGSRKGRRHGLGCGAVAHGI